MQKLADDNPAVIDFRAVLANSHTNLAYELSRMGKPTEAEAECRAAVTIFGKVVDDNPKVLFHRELLAMALSSLGDWLLKLGRPAEALDAYERAITLSEQLIKENPADKDYPATWSDRWSGAGGPAGLWATPPARRPTSGMH